MNAPYDWATDETRWLDPVDTPTDIAPNGFRSGTLRLLIAVALSLTIVLAVMAGFMWLLIKILG